jgi:excinuclease UvrABC nuclease subunit
MQPRHIRERVSHTVYELMDESGVRVYVGMSITSRLDARIATHKRKPWWPKVAHVETTELFGRSVALIHEARLIERHQPEGNYYHTLRAKGPRRQVARDA